MRANKERFDSLPQNEVVQEQKENQNDELSQNEATQLNEGEEKKTETENQ